MSLPRRLVSWALTAAAAGYLFLALELPDTVVRPLRGWWVPGALLRIPLEGILGGALLAALPRRARKVTGIVLGVLLGLLVLARLTSMGFAAVFARMFVPALDWPLFGDGFNALAETDGAAVAWLAVAVVALLVIAVPVLTVLAVLRLSRLAAAHEKAARRSLVAALAAWTAFGLTGTMLYPYAPVAANQIVAEVYAGVRTTRTALNDRRVFAAEAGADGYAAVPPDEITAGLRGHDVVIGVVESYGRAALEEPQMAAVTGPALADATRRLATAGFQARSGWLTSSTYGGGSWLAHATLQSGLWIDNPMRYRQLVSGDRLTITQAFHRAGWPTYGFEPGNTAAWSEAGFYGYDRIFDQRNLGYRGRRFGWSSMPDQFVLSRFQQEVYAGRTGPVFAELTLTSSHEPWTRVPLMLPWDQVGDGAVYGPMASAVYRLPQDELWRDRQASRAAYARSVVYAVDSLVGWVTTYADPDAVLVIFGDHQALPLISGQGAGHDVPITIVAHDPAVLDRLAAFGWTGGLKPQRGAPVWRMDQFRDRFFGAFSGTPGAGATGPSQR